MSHSEEGDNYWPGYVDALTSMVQVLAFVMMMLAMAVFVLSQSVSKHAVEAIAKAANAEVKPNSDMKQLTQAVIEKIQKIASSASQPPSAVPDTQLLRETIVAQPVQTEAANESAREMSTTTRVGSGRQRTDQPPVQLPNNTPRLTIEFEERNFKLDQRQTGLLSRFVDENRITDRAGAATVNAYASSADGALSEARRLAYYRGMMVRKQLIELKASAENVKINVVDTADKAKGATVEIVAAGIGSSER